MSIKSIENVLFSESSVFSTLCDLAGLDRQRDLRYTNLSYVDFRNSDLRFYNFVGANLDGARFGNAYIDETTIFHEGQNLKNMDRLQRAEFLTEIRHFKCGNESEKFSALQALLIRFPQYSHFGGIALEYLRSPSEDDQRRGIELFRRFLGLKGAGREELFEVTGIFEAQMERLGQGLTHSLLLPSFMALLEQGFCRAFKYRGKLLALAGRTDIPLISTLECLIELGDERNVINLLLTRRPNQKALYFFEQNFDRIIRLREAKTVLAHFQSHFQNSRTLSGFSNFMNSIVTVMEEIRKLKIDKDRPFPRAVWEPLQRLENSTRLPLCAANKRLLLSGCALVREHPSARREDIFKLKSIFSSMKILN